MKVTRNKPNFVEELANFTDENIPSETIRLRQHQYSAINVSALCNVSQNIETDRKSRIVLVVRKAFSNF